MLPAETDPTQKQLKEKEKHDRSTTRRMKRSQTSDYIGYIVWLVAAISATSVFSFQNFYFSKIGQITNIVEPASICGAFVVSFLCARRYGFKLRERVFDRIWFFIMLGMALWAAANIVWSSNYFLGIAVPYPGLSDYFYLGADIPLAAALVMYFRPFSTALTLRRLGICAIVTAVSAGIIIGFVMRSEFAITQPLTATITDLAYPISDIVLLSLTILNLAIFIGGTIGKWWILNGAGIVLYIVADELFLYQNSQGTYYNGSSSDMVYVLSYLVFALAYYVHRREL
ncbi:MAG: hypothetical protein OK457_06910 [Thaumarchaeota archaeon]|nr:hypothetical protein [Nitrososphaerota archaeon]